MNGPALALAAQAGAPLAIAQAAGIDAALRACSADPGETCLSEHAFANLYLFRQAHDYRFVAGSHPRVTGLTYDGARHVLPLFALDTAPRALLQALLRGHDCFYPLSAAQVARLDPAVFNWSAVRADADYLYPAANFAAYRGTTLSRKRNLMKQLLAAHAVTARPYHAGLARQAMTVHAQWMAAKRKAQGEADDAPCAEALREAERLGLEGFLYEAGGQPVGFVLAQEIRPAVFAMRFAKGLDAYKGIYQYMFHHFCTAFARPVAWLNFEQDLGLDNFRQTKQSYAPSALLPKYRVTLRTD
ncbi:phosphatidylglycerol lysyltransferase domain-containing protein [Cupriavidus basilensis]|uniref:phosphatidylglycerol lysyltransferase domain-containing protein n=1 Tax=Cupriavidus basilensis TaxID=68895 RepID=UPI000A61F8B9|nr:phosphatidylglycerol lysyltransferase domain-containing protein [Cupriavidus basilensis]